MGQKANPISLRLQKTNRFYESNWYSHHSYTSLFSHSLALQKYLNAIFFLLHYPPARCFLKYTQKKITLYPFLFNPIQARKKKRLLKPPRKPFASTFSAGSNQGLSTKANEILRFSRSASDAREAIAFLAPLAPRALQKAKASQSDESATSEFLKFKKKSALQQKKKIIAGVASCSAREAVASFALLAEQAERKASCAKTKKPILSFARSPLTFSEKYLKKRRNSNFTKISFFYYLLQRETLSVPSNGTQPAAVLAQREDASEKQKPTELLTKSKTQNGHRSQSEQSELAARSEKVAKSSHTIEKWRTHPREWRNPLWKKPVSGFTSLSEMSFSKEKIFHEAFQLMCRKKKKKYFFPIEKQFYIRFFLAFYFCCFFDSFRFSAEAVSRTFCHKKFSFAAKSSLISHFAQLALQEKPETSASCTAFLPVSKAGAERGTERGAERQEYKVSFFPHSAIEKVSDRSARSAKKLHKVDGLLTEVNGLLTEVNGLLTEVNSLRKNVTFFVGKNKKAKQVFFLTVFKKLLTQFFLVSLLEKEPGLQFSTFSSLRLFLRGLESSTFVDKSSTFVDKSSTFVDKSSTFVDKSSTFVDKSSTFVDKSSIFRKKSKAVDKSSSFQKHRLPYLVHKKAKPNIQPPFFLESRPKKLPKKVKLAEIEKKTNSIVTSLQSCKVLQNRALAKLRPVSPLVLRDTLYRKHLESLFCQHIGFPVELLFFQVFSESQSALFLAHEIVYYLERKIVFRKLKTKFLREIREKKNVRGIRITCSGRLGGKAKKAQRSKTECVKAGQTSLHVFSASIDFCQKHALTPFGKVGVKVWICYV